jgi:hypothetical protein
LQKVTGLIQDDTLKDATAAFSALAPLLRAKPTAAAGETTRLDNTVRGSRVVAYRRFDLNDSDFEQQVCDFVEYHMNACHDCKGPKYPDFLQSQYSDVDKQQDIFVASGDNVPPSSRRK